MDGFRKIIFKNRKMILSSMYSYYIPKLYDNTIHKGFYYLHIRYLEQIVNYRYENDF